MEPMGNPKAFEIKASLNQNHQNLGPSTQATNLETPPKTEPQTPKPLNPEVEPEALKPKF